MQRWRAATLVGALLGGCGGGMPGGLSQSPMLSMPAITSSRGNLDPTLTARINAVASALVTLGQVVGLVVGVHDRGQEQIFAYGEVVKGSGTLPTASTVFEIGSVTKTFTATLFALFMQRGLVGFDDPLQQYLPEWGTVPSYNGRQITLIDLAGIHRSRGPAVDPRRHAAISAL
jgi:CubicO group peptidase (beta-lactamase class C family)